MNLKNIFNLFSQSIQQCVSRLRRLFLSNRKFSSVGRNLRETSPDMAGAGSIIGNPVMDEGNMVRWSDLPSDILHCVASRLELVDQIRFRAVCKSWRRIRELKPNDKLPWIFMVNESGFRVINRKPHYYLYDLHHQKLYSVTIQRWCTRMRLWGFESTYIICIKLGWLLVNPLFWNWFLLFNPFTQKLIYLPKLPRDLLRPLSTFRYCLKSRRFVVYATNPCVIGGVIIIKRWKSGDREWESSNFAAEFPSFMKKIIKIELVGEALYCIFETGVVGSFNECHKSWSVVVKHSEDDKLFYNVDNLLYTFEYRGELLMMDFHNYSKFDLWHLDQSKGSWVEVVQFHKSAIFCSYLDPFSCLCSEQFIVPSDPVATRIYFFKYPYSGVRSIAYNHVHRTSDDFDPFHIMNVKFPWSYGTHRFKSFPYHWIEPCP